MPADVNSVNEEIKNEAKKVWQSKTGKERLKYFVYYYKVHFLVAVAAIAFISYVIYWYATLKDTVFQVIVVNGQIAENFDYQKLLDDFDERVDYDRKEEQIVIDGTYQINVQATDQYNTAYIQKIFMNVQTNDLDVLLCDEDLMKLTRAQNCAGDLSKFLPKDMQEKYADQLVWYDFPVEEVGEEFYEEDYAGRYEACSIDITEFAKVKNSDMFLGQQAYAIIIANSQHIEDAVAFLEYLDE